MSLTTFIVIVVAGFTDAISRWQWRVEQVEREAVVRHSIWQYVQ